MDTHSLHPVNVLLVDDDHSFVASTARALAAAGFRVTTASNYFDALDILDVPENTIDVLVTDVTLDRGNGFALARMARYHRHHIKAVYVTGLDVQLEEAIGPVLRKPVAADVMVATVIEATTPKPARCA
jgi:DNA-binding NtrC family response regulator